jgi:hypothetical protein
MKSIVSIVALAGLAFFAFRFSESLPRSHLGIEGQNPKYLTITDNRKFLEYSIKVVNHSDQIILLDSDLPTSCGCSTATVNKPRLDPGEKTAINLEVQLKPGAQYITVQIPVLEPADVPPLRFQLHIEAPMAWRISPPRNEVRYTEGQPCQLRWTLIGPNLPSPKELKLELKLAGFEIEATDWTIYTDRLDLLAKLRKNDDSSTHRVTSGTILITDEKNEDSVEAAIIARRQ